METLFIPNETDFKRWVREAVREYFEDQSLTPVSNEKKNESELIGRKEMASILKISLVTLTARVKQGLPAYKQGASVYFLKNEVFEYMRRYNARRLSEVPKPQ